MDVGLTIPTRGPLATPDSIATLARRAEELGFDHLSVSDHLVVPRSIDSRYPYSESGSLARRGLGRMPRAVHAAGLARGDHQQAPPDHRGRGHPLSGAMHTAKIAATIDVLSDGRMVLGAGAGWMKEEFEAVGAPPFEERGRVTDEWLQAFKILWTEDAPQLRGPPRALRRHQLPAQARAEAAPADLGRRREPARAAPHGALRRRLVPDRQQPAPSARHGRALQGGVAQLHQVAEQNGRDPETHRARVLRRLVRRDEAGRARSRAASATS